MPLVQPKQPNTLELAAIRAKAALLRKKTRTPLEDALAADGGASAVRLVQWARTQRTNYDTGLVQWRANRMKYAQEAADVFVHRAAAREREREQNGDEPASVFEIQNDSLNLVAALAEFASAQAEMDIYGSDPWFAAKPVGKADPELAQDIQRHLQWTFRDGRFVDIHAQAITTAVALGEAFTKTFYQIDVDEFERSVPCLHINGKPVADAEGNFITTDEQAKTLPPAVTKGKAEWKNAFQTEQTIIRQGVEVIPIHFNDISFREDAPELDLRYTNVYVSVEMSVFEAMRRFKLSKEDAIRLAKCAEVGKQAESDKLQEAKVDQTMLTPLPETPLGEDEATRLINTRVRLIEGYVYADVTGKGQQSRCLIVFPPYQDEWIVWADYLGNVSPKSELPIKCDVWEPVPYRLYGNGFFGKYAYVQLATDNLWNQINFRNAMHANPLTAIRKDRIEQDDDSDAIEIKPGLSIQPKGQFKLSDCIEFGELPDLDQRSMELMQVGMQIAQLRSGITSASQGDLSAAPENNTATGIRSLLSRAAVLLKKPIRRMRRCKGRSFGYATKLHYANFDRQEAFVWGEGEAAELVTMSPEMIANLDIEVQMLMTQDQNQEKLQSAQAAMTLGQFYVSLLPPDRVQWFPVIAQGLKALDFDISSFQPPQMPVAIPQTNPTPTQATPTPAIP
jgi:hypothetical protein